MKIYSFSHHIVHMFCVPYDVRNPMVSFRDNLRHIPLFEAGKRNLVDFTKMKRGKASEYSVILTAFYPFLVKFLISRLSRIFSKRVVTMFWVLRSLP